MMIASNGRSVDGSPVWKKRILVPQPAQRQLYIDEGLASPDAYSVRYTTKQWWDQPTTRHGDGTTFSYADGHWTPGGGLETVKSRPVSAPIRNLGEVTEEGIKMSKWGKWHLGQVRLLQ
jgi:prepilin-type processing-associated H-X9-DG protein